MTASTVTTLPRIDGARYLAVKAYLRFRCAQLGLRRDDMEACVAHGARTYRAGDCSAAAAIAEGMRVAHRIADIRCGAPGSAA